MLDDIKVKLPDGLNVSDLATKLKDPWWRLNNLYWILTKKGDHIKFKPNWAQTLLFKGMWWRTLVLKARQLGITTFMGILELDRALFQKNQRCVLIAHKQRPDGEEIYNRVICHAYNSLIDPIKQTVRRVKEEAWGRVRFSNGSDVRVAVSARSGVCQILHISEFGKTCAEYPKKATEIVTGSFPACEEGIICIESTAEGQSGYFYNYCMTALERQRKGRTPTRKQWKIFFFPWWKEPKYALSNEDTRRCVLPKHLVEYFHRIRLEHDIVLTPNQQAWYAQTLENMQTGRGDVSGDWSLMKREFPSFPEEAFEQAIQGAYYAEQLTKAEQDGRITKIPPTPGVPVDTWWDLGVGDLNCIWFSQDIGRERIHMIDYYENSDVGLTHYLNILQKKAQERGLIYRKHTAPHDIEQRVWSADAKTRLQIAAELGIRFKIAPRMPLEDGIDACRRIFQQCWFDEEHCSDGLHRLKKYKKKWNEKTNSWGNPVHDDNSHGADAFRTFATGHQFDFRVQGNGFFDKEVDASAWS